MLRIVVPEYEFFDEATEEFVYFNGGTLILEHSLLSISKWEAKWKKPFLKSDKTREETLDYIRCMTVNQNVNPLIYSCLSGDAINEISDYMNDSMTATTIREDGKSSNQIVTSEVIYYWMIAQNVPIEFEKWHINRLLTLLKVCAINTNPNKKKMSRADIARQNRELNKQRRAKFNTKG